MKFEGHYERTGGELHGGFLDVVRPARTTDAILLTLERIREGVVAGYEAALVAFFNLDDYPRAIGREADYFEPGAIADAELTGGAGFEVAVGGEVGLGPVCAAFDYFLRECDCGKDGECEGKECFHRKEV